MLQEWFKTHWEEISGFLSKVGRFNFDIFPLFKNPLFDIILLLVMFVLLILRFYRLLVICLSVLVFAIAWSFLCAPYGGPGAVPFVHWWFLIGICISLVVILLYVCLVVLGE
jgi:hypothetical protein